MSRRETESSGGSGSGVEALGRALGALKRGEVIVFPTETFYGLGADAFDSAAVDRVVSLKGRDPQNPIPIIVADEKMLGDVVREVPAMARRLIDRFWPGPLTLVLPAKETLPRPLLNRDGGIGVRISSHPVATRLARELGRPLTATSANSSGKEPARTIEEAASYFSTELTVFLDGGELRGTRGSTVVEITEDGFRVIREGEIARVELEKALK